MPREINNIDYNNTKNIYSNNDTTIQRESQQRQILINNNNNCNENENYSIDSNCMEKMYLFLDELGSGGFGKVKLAKHILTGDQVAIKIIDKKSIPNDLPRVYSEMEALKQLAHQNICRLFQFRETDDKFYIVMEYCNGGEMFDYIVRKERLCESEARHFFRQLVQGVAYIHSMGFAHRDLKPENLLLTNELQLKVIDFGLCARPLNGLSRPLETCCGSPAYAAPELIQNQSYFGNEADIWSMGVLLYALLCGVLPFDDTNMPRLYKQITLGQYFEPEFLSLSCKELLRMMLTVDPKKRATIKQILIHPWLNCNYEQQIKWQSIYNRDIVDEEIIRELVCCFKINKDEMINRIKQWRFDYVCATYLILLQRKEQKKNFSLPFYDHNDKNFKCNLPFSPTIHSSLENDLDLSGFEDDIIKLNSNFDNSNEKITERFNKALALCSPPVFTNTKQTALQQTHSPYENIKQLPPKLDSTSITPRKPQQRKPSYEAPTHHRTLNSNKGGCSVYTTPRRCTVELPGPVGGFAYRRPNSVDRPPSIRSESNSNVDENSPPDLVHFNNKQKSDSCERTSRIDMCRGNVNGNNNTKQLNNNKSPHRFRQRVFSSLERKADKMISLLTPKKIKSEAPAKFKFSNTIANVSITSSCDPVKVREELWKVLCNMGMNATKNGWKVSGSRKNSNDPQNDATVELEVITFEELKYVGVKRRRVNGEPFTYKRICEQILGLAGL